MVPEQIQKSIWNLKESIKDNIDSSIVEAVKQNLLSVDGAQAARVIEITKTAIDEGYHKAFSNCLKTIERALEVEVAKEAKKLLKK